VLFYLLLGLLFVTCNSGHHVLHQLLNSLLTFVFILSLHSVAHGSRLELLDLLQSLVKLLARGLLVTDEPIFVCYSFLRHRLFSLSSSQMLGQLQVRHLLGGVKEQNFEREVEAACWFSRTRLHCQSYFLHRHFREASQVQLEETLSFVNITGVTLVRREVVLNLKL
jgi:hypothetical protein